MIGAEPTYLGDDAGSQRHEIEFVDAELERMLLSEAHLDELGHETVQPVRLPHDDVRGVFIDGTASPHQLGDATDGREGIAKLVSEDRDPFAPVALELAFRAQDAESEEARGQARPIHPSDSDGEEDR